MKSDEEMEFKSFKDMSIYRDIFIWLFCLLVLPIIILSVSYAIKIPANKIDSVNDEKLTTIIQETNSSLMKKISLKKYKNSLCNDGSPASYYLRKTKSSNWIVVLEGGFFCYDIVSCKQRYENSFNLTSSKSNREFKTGTGILSTSIDENKHFHNANLVNIPYCSSDLWIGNSNGDNSNESFKFKGSQIIEDVLTDLLNNYQMKESKNIILSGISAGGIGLILNLNKIKEKLEVNARNAKIKAILDSSWFIDLPYSYLCNNNLNDDNCLIRKILTDSIRYWNASFECKTTDNIIDCFLPDKLIKSIKSKY